MHKLQNGSQVTGRPVRKPRVGTRGYFSESNDQGAPSHPGQDWFNDCIDEFANALEQADIPYDPQRLDHLARAIAEAKANWGADVVSQSEAQAGTATTARKWTAQRVHQAFKKFGIGKSFASSDVSNNAANFFVENPTCFYAANFSGDEVIPNGESCGYQFKTVGGFGHRVVIRAGGVLQAFIQRISGNNIQAAVELIHSLNEKFLGVNQSPTDVTTLRQSNVVYTNSTNKPIAVFISMDQTTSVSVNCHQIRENVSSSWIDVGGKSATALTNVSYIVPAGYQYRCQRSDIISWSELR